MRPLPIFPLLLLQACVAEAPVPDAMSPDPSAPAADAPDTSFADAASSTPADDSADEPLSEAAPDVGAPAEESASFAEFKAVLDEAGCTAGCHAALAAIGDLDLETDLYSDLVDAKSDQVDLLLVAPGDLHASYLWHKLVGTFADPAIGGYGSTMPIGADPLTEDQLETISSWIRGGAAR